MTFIVLDSGGTRELCPPGSYSAVCIDVVDLGQVETHYKDKTKMMHKCRVVFEIAERKPDGSPFTIGERFTASLAEKSTLRKFLEGWRGRAFTPDELKGFDLEALIGAPAIVAVVHRESGGKIYDNIASASKLMKGMPALQPSGKYVRVKNRPTAPNGTAPLVPEPEPTYEEELETLPF